MAQNDDLSYREALKAEFTPISPCFSLLFHFQCNMKNMCPLSQTYSNDGIKLFLFQEYGPLRTHLDSSNHCGNCIPWQLLLE